MKPYTILLILLITALACQTTTLTQTFLPGGSLFYQDQFSDPASGWGDLTLEAGAAGYADGAYRIIVNQPNVHIWSHPGLALADVHVEVDVFPAAGPLENRMGVICRLVDDQNFYFFAISADGYYGIGKLKAGQVTILTGGGNMLPSEIIQTGNVPNRVRGDCSGQTLSLYVNNLLVDFIEDSEFTSGDVGLLSGTFSQPGADVYFDNFFVFKP